MDMKNLFEIERKTSHLKFFKKRSWSLEYLRTKLISQCRNKKKEIVS